MTELEYFSSYEGDRPYIFISYAHLDAEDMLRIMAPLHQKGYRIWYDEGISPGSEWPENIARHLSGSKLVLLIISKNSINSENCAREAGFALEQGKQILLIYLDDIPVWEEYRRNLSKKPRILLKSDADETAIFANPTAAKLLSKKLVGNGKTGYNNHPDFGSAKRRFQRFMLGILLILICGISGYIRFFWQPQEILIEKTPMPSITAAATQTVMQKATATPRPTLPYIPESINTSFSSGTLSNAVRSALGLNDEEEIPKYRFNEIEELILCGNLFTTDRTKISKTDHYYLDGVRVGKGDVSDLSELEGMSSLRELTLCWQQIRNVLPLRNLRDLTYLDLSGNPIENVSSLVYLPVLRIVDLSNTKVKDLSVLNSSDSIEQVFISGEMLPVTTNALKQKFDIIITR